MLLSLAFQCSWNHRAVYRGWWGSPLFGLNRCVPLNRVWFAGHWLFKGIQFHYLVSVGCVFGLDASKGDVTWDDWQRQFFKFSEHSISFLEQCCNHSKLCRNNVAMLCCTKNLMLWIVSCNITWKECEGWESMFYICLVPPFFHKNIIDHFWYIKIHTWLLGVGE